MAPKRAFGGVLRPFGGGFRGPNRERASVFSGAGRGRCRGFCGGAGAGPARSAAQDGGGAGGSAVEPGGGASVFSGAGRGRGQRVQRWGPVRDGGGTGGGSAAQAGAGPACSAARDRGGTGSSEVQTGRGQRVQRRGIGAGRGVQRCRRDGPAAGSQKSVPKGRCARRQDAKKVFRGEGAPPPEHIRAQKKRTSVRSLLFLLLYGLLLRDARPIHPAARQRLRTPGARLFCGRLPAACSPATACLPSISVCPSVGVTAVKASAIRSLSRSAARRSGLSRLAAGISAVRVAPRESLRPPPGSQFSAAGVTVLSRRGHSSQPSGVSAVRSPELAVPAARPLRRRGHSTTTSVWPSTCNWRISCVELT